MNLLFVEAWRFTESVIELRAEESLRKLQDLLCQNPESGDVIKGTGGFRKIRMGLPGRGKRGGCRVIYLHIKQIDQIHFVYLYPKNKAADLTPDQKKTLKQLSQSIYEKVKKS